MKKSLILTVVGTLVFVTGTIFAASSFQNTCSNIGFEYKGQDPTLKAVCLKANGTAQPSTLILQGISNVNGKLVQGSGASSFQKSCGNIQIVVVNTSTVNLVASCRTAKGTFAAASLRLNGIGNNNGKLAQK
ncbi:MAG: CVNH domain-containing protein [Leptospirales bacterium]